MKVVESVSGMMSLSRRIRRDGRTIGLVPTMGALHKGHLSLVRAAKSDTDAVVMSVFVNPIQFGRGEDFAGYPRDFTKDKRLARNSGVDIIFRPTPKEMYPEGYSTYVFVEGLTDGLCGASRPGHFRGVATIVTKLFNIVRPDAAYFGQKDAQQAAVIKRMVRDLNMDVRVRIMPIVREAGAGLAMSSRNAYLSASERPDAAVLNQALKRAESLIHAGMRDSTKIKRAIMRIISTRPSARVEYVSIVDAKNLKDKKTISGEVLIALAVFIGRTRLIDNIIVKV